MTADLFDQVTSFGSLRRAAGRAARGHLRSRDVAEFMSDLERSALSLERRLRDGSWSPSTPTTFRIRDPKPRTISASPFADRVVHHALCAVVEPILDADADSDSYACRRGRGTHAAVRRVQHLARHHAWSLKLDIRHFFETVPHFSIRAILVEALPDARATQLFEQILAVGASSPGVGLPIGALTSQLLANACLGAVDRYARQVLQVGGWVRYMDDMIAFGRDKATLRGHAAAIDVLVRGQGLTLKHEATCVAPVAVGIPFLGFRIWPRLIRLDAARVRRLRRRLRALDRAAAAGRLAEGDRVRRVGSLVAWVSHANTLKLRQSLFASPSSN